LNFEEHIQTVKDEEIGLRGCVSIEILERVGISYYNLSDYQISIDYLMMSLNIRKIVYRGGHICFLKSYFNIGEVQRFLGNFQKAKKYFN
jgi:tetratricopeptide (TPR) repeat protein